MADDRWLVPLSDVAVDEEILHAAADAVGSGWWSAGPRVSAFEDAFRDLCGTEHALAVSSCTAALHLALLALGCEPDDEVILPSLTFVAAANVVVRAGATPVFCDVRGGDDLNLDPDDLAAAVTPRTKAIIALHYGGVPCDMDAVMTIAASHGLAVVEDAAHAPGACLDGRPCGSIGTAGCFSFFSNKNLPIGEGGMLVTNDAELAEAARLYRSHGMTTLTWDRHRGHASSYDVVLNGLNYRMDEVRAAVGLVQLSRLGGGNAARARHAARYRQLLDGKNGIVLTFADPAQQRASAHHLAVALLPAGVDRDTVRDELATRRIQTSVHYPPIHRFSAFRETRPLRRTEDVASRLLTLPLYPHMRDDQVDTVAGALLEVVGTSASKVSAAGC